MKNQYIVIIVMFFLMFYRPFYCETLSSPPSNFSDVDAGTVENPFLINNLANLRWLSETKSVWGDVFERESANRYYFSQTADIDATETKSWNSGSGFRAIGRSDIRIQASNIDEGRGYVLGFAGDYDGNGFVIKNIFINNTSTESQEDAVNGFFGVLANAHISNVHIENITIIAGNTESDAATIGALCVALNESVLYNSSASGVIIKFGGLTGGLVGVSQMSSIDRCFSKVSIICKEDIESWTSEGNPYSPYMNMVFTGGLVGFLASSSLSNSFYVGYINTQSTHNPYGDMFGMVVDSDRHAVYSINDKVYTWYESKDKWHVFPKLRYDARKMSRKQAQDARFFSNRGWDFENVWAINPEVNGGYPFLMSMMERF